MVSVYTALVIKRGFILFLLLAFKPNIHVIIFVLHFVPLLVYLKIMWTFTVNVYLGMRSTNVPSLLASQCEIKEKSAIDCTNHVWAG